MMMTNFDAFKNTMIKYLNNNGISLTFVSNLHDVSINKEQNPPNYVYDAETDLDIIDMDSIAKYGYKLIKNAEGVDNIVNTADAFIINKENKWFLIEFKDSEIKADKSGLKNNVLKKAYSNWYMILDILYSMKESGSPHNGFLYENPVEFAKTQVYYILVCSTDKNPIIYQQIKNHDLIGENYTPPFMQRLKDYIFKDAYVYTEQFLERKFVNGFTY